MFRYGLGMGLLLDNLDGETRQYMLQELDFDLANDNLYFSKWFTDQGKLAYPELCRAAILYGSDVTLANALSAVGIFMSEYAKRTPKGGTTVAAVPYTAPVTFAEGEFNRFYLRGLCARLVAEGKGRVEIYRARLSEKPRTASQALVGTILDPIALLADLRTNTGVDTALGLPPGPNSGLSGKSTN